jgi:hypothetical protein
VYRHGHRGPPAVLRAGLNRSGRRSGRGRPRPDGCGEAPTGSFTERTIADEDAEFWYHVRLDEGGNTATGWLSTTSGPPRPRRNCPHDRYRHRRSVARCYLGRAFSHTVLGSFCELTWLLCLASSIVVLLVYPGRERWPTGILHRRRGFCAGDPVASTLPLELVDQSAEHCPAPDPHAAEGLLDRPTSGH